MSNDLIAPEDLGAFPGAPFSDEVVDAAVAGLRAAAGWHIAPSRTETVTVDSPGGYRLILDTLYLTAVNGVRNVLDVTPSEITGVRFSKAGILAGCFPCGFQSVEVDIMHGYAATPPDLLPLLASACQRITVDTSVVASQGAGPFSVTFRDPATSSVDPGLARYALPSRP
ncbi:MAG: hypothetical protein H0X12_04065 [Nocardioides sp.]|nr:hypothetical protein [Nocardioides sp.]